MRKTAADPNSNFYESLAADYHLLFPDWQASVLQQAETLSTLIRSECGEGGLGVLDCACGIGTQALGIAQMGFRVWASDLSPAAVARARREALARGLQIDFKVADMRNMVRQPAAAFDVVLACDNAVPHLLSRREILMAAENMYAQLKPGGLVVISTRDYDRLLETKPRSTPLKVIDDHAGRRVVFQVWDWLPGEDVYDVQQFIVEKDEGGWRTSVYETTYRAWRRAALLEIFLQAGFQALRWRMPTESGYYQPILLGRR